MRRFFAASRDGENLWLTKNDSRHLRLVLRRNCGTEVVIIYKHEQYLCTLSEWIGTQYLASIISVMPTPILKIPTITLLLAVQKSQNLKYTLLKITELGVNKIRLFNSERSTARFTKEMIAQKINRWKLIIASAIKQSGGSTPPTIKFLTNINDYLAQKHQKTTKILCNEKLSQTNNSCIQFRWLALPKHCQKEIILIIGPEGGFTNQEVTNFQQNNCWEWRFCSAVLKCDTAAITALILFNYLTRKWN